MQSLNTISVYKFDPYQLFREINLFEGKSNQDVMEYRKVNLTVSLIFRYGKKEGDLNLVTVIVLQTNFPN